MSHVHRRWLVAGSAIAAGGLFGAAAARDAAPSRDPRWDMINTLRAAGPLVSEGEDPQARIFDVFMGTWDTDFTFISEDGSRRPDRGQLIAGWVLDGRALQDLWILHPNSTDRPQRWMGTTLRFFDSERKTWRITWVSPLARAVTLLEGGGEGDRIVLQGESPSGRLRWTFNDITPSAFVWRGELSVDNGATWRLREEHQMRRARA